MTLFKYNSAYLLENIVSHQKPTNTNVVHLEKALTRRQLLKVASLNMSGRQLLKASQALNN